MVQWLLGRPRAAQVAPSPTPTRTPSAATLAGARPDDETLAVATTPTPLQEAADIYNSSLRSLPNSVHSDSITAASVQTAPAQSRAYSSNRGRRGRFPRSRAREGIDLANVYAKPTWLDRYYHVVQSGLIRGVGFLTNLSLQRPFAVIATILVVCCVVIGAAAPSMRVDRSALVAVSLTRMRQSRLESILPTPIPVGGCGITITISPAVSNSVLSTKAINSAFQAITEMQSLEFDVNGQSTSLQDVCERIVPPPRTVNGMPVRPPGPPPRNDGTVCGGRCFTHLFPPDLSSFLSTTSGSRAERIAALQKSAAKLLNGTMPLAVFGEPVVDSNGVVRDMAAWECFIPIMSEALSSQEWMIMWEDAMLERQRNYADVLVRGHFITDTLPTTVDGFNMIAQIVAAVLVVTILVTSPLSLDASRISICLGVMISNALACSLAISIVALIQGKVSIATVVTLPVLVLSIGMDNVYVITDNLASAQRNFRFSLGTLVSKAMQHSASFIAITTITDMAAFAVGVWVDIPAVREWCMCATVALLFVSLFHMTFLVACLSIDDMRRSMQLMDVLCCIRLSRPMSRDAGADGWLGRRLRRHLRFAVRKSVDSRILHVGGALVALTMLVVGLYGIANLPRQTDLPVAQLMRRSRSNSVFEFESSRPFGSASETMLVAFGDPEPQMTELFRLHRRVQAVPRVPGVRWWLPQFLSWQAKPSSAGLLNNTKTFAERVSKFVGNPAGASFIRDIVFDNQGGIALSTMLVPVNSRNCVEVYKAIDQVVAQSPLDATFVSVNKLLTESDDSVYSIVMWSFVFGLVAIFLAVAITMRLDAGIIAALMVFTIDTSFFGFLWLSDSRFNVSVEVNLLFMFGFSVHYSVRVMHAYVEEVTGGRALRIRNALNMALPPIVAAALVAICPALLLFESPFHLIQSYAADLLVVIGLSFFHAVVSQSVFLYYLGPQPKAIMEW